MYGVSLQVRISPRKEILYPSTMLVSRNSFQFKSEICTLVYIGIHVSKSMSCLALIPC